MIHEKTLELINQIVRTGYYLRIFPWLWDNDLGLVSVEKKWELVLWRMVTWNHILVRIVICIYCMVVLLILDVEEWEKIIFLVPLAFLVLTITTAFQMLRTYKHAVVLTSSLIQFNKKLEEFYDGRTTNDTSDRLKTLRWMIKHLPPSMTILSWPAITALLSINLKSLAVLDVFDFVPGHRIIIGFFASYFGATDWSLYCNSILLTATYLDSTLYWIRQHTWPKEEFSKEKIEGVLTMYRSHRFLHTYLTDLSTVLALAYLCTGSVVIVTTCYSFIYLMGQIHISIPVLLVTIGWIMYAILHLLFHKMNDLTNDSITCLNSLVSNIGNGSNGRCLRRVLRSFRPIRTPVGHFYIIKKTTFATITKDFILNYIISALLTWRRHKLNNFIGSTS